jgi:hypothetical protein
MVPGRLSSQEEAELQGENELSLSCFQLAKEWFKFTWEFFFWRKLILGQEIRCLKAARLINLTGLRIKYQMLPSSAGLSKHKVSDHSTVGVLSLVAWSIINRVHCSGCFFFSTCVRRNASEQLDRFGCDELGLSHLIMHQWEGWWGSQCRDHKPTSLKRKCPCIVKRISFPQVLSQWSLCLWGKMGPGCCDQASEGGAPSVLLRNSRWEDLTRSLFSYPNSHGAWGAYWTAIFALIRLTPKDSWGAGQNSCFHAQMMRSCRFRDFFTRKLVGAGEEPDLGLLSTFSEPLYVTGINVSMC